MYIGSIVINVTDIARATDFWSAALGYVVRHAEPRFVVLHDPRRRWANISLQWTDKPKQELNRLHLDLYASQQAAEIARLEQLGARRIPWHYDADDDFVVMVDPDGNEFCVIDSPFPQE